MVPSPAHLRRHVRPGAKKLGCWQSESRRRSRASLPASRSRGGCAGRLPAPVPQGTTLAPEQVMPGRRTAPQQSAPTWRRRAGRSPPSPSRAPLAHRASLPQLEPRARSLTSRRLLLFRRHRRSHPAGSAAPGPAAWRAPGSPCAGPGGGPGVSARAHAGLCPVRRRPPLQPLGARPAEAAERAAGNRPPARSGRRRTGGGRKGRRAGRSHGGPASPRRPLRPEAKCVEARDKAP